MPAEEFDRARKTVVRRQPEQTVLHGIVREHLETFLAEARRRGGDRLPSFVERELREFLTCGVVARSRAEPLSGASARRIGSGRGARRLVRGAASSRVAAREQPGVGAAGAGERELVTEAGVAAVEDAVAVATGPQVQIARKARPRQI